jgi:hypothetical protein
LSADPDQKHWLDRKLVDVPASAVHQVAVRPSSGPEYLLTRATRADPDLTLTPVPLGRKVASSMVVDGQAETLAAFNFDDVRALPQPAPAATDHATYKLFDGQVLGFDGHKEGDKAFVTVNGSRDAALTAQFAAAAPATPAPTPTSAPAGSAAPQGNAANTAPAAKPAAPQTPAKPADHTVEQLAARAQGVEFEIPLYKYESLFKPLESLLEKKPEPPAKAPLKAAKPATKPPANPPAKPEPKQ